MKKLLLLTIMTMLGMASYAQQLRVPDLGLVKAGKADIITEQPEGELRTYVRSGGATRATLYFENKRRQDGMVSNVVFAPDGETVYFQNIVSHAANGTWVKGTIKGDSILVPLGQIINWWDEDDNGQKNYGTQLAMVTVKGSHTSYTSTTDGNAIFTIKGDSLILEDTAGDPTENMFVGLGLTYTNQFEGEWSCYLDYETVYTRIYDEPVTPPEGLETVKYGMTHGIYGHFVNVGFDGNDVYVQGIAESYLPKAWIKGTITSDNKIYFPSQYVGPRSVFHYYLFGTQLKHENDYYGGTYSHIWDGGKGATFDYDPETRTFWTEQGIVFNNSKDSLLDYERYAKTKFAPYVERAVKPADPKIMQIDDRFWAYGYSLSTVAISVPCMDDDGNFIDPTKLWYSLYVDDDEPYLLYQDEYDGLPYDGVDEIPYLFSNGKSIWGQSYGLYIYQNGFDRMGIKSIYYGGDDRIETDIFYTKPASVGIGKVEAGENNAGAVYDLSGRRVAEPSRGLYIKNGKKYNVK